MTPQFLISTLFLLAFLGVLFWFYSENKKLEKQHLKNKVGLIEKFSLHQRQIKKRQFGLDTYDFLEFNLSQALIIQSEIKIL